MGVRAIHLAAAEIGLTDGMGPAECVRYFNPLSRDELDETLRVWEARVALLLDHAGRGGASLMALSSRQCEHDCSLTFAVTCPSPPLPLTQVGTEQCRGSSDFRLTAQW